MNFSVSSDYIKYCLYCGITVNTVNKDSVITCVTSQIFNINTIWDWQVEAMNHVVFNDAPLTLISQRTADGKSLVPLSICAVRRKVGVVLVPLQGLGSDQVNKAIVVGHNVKAYYANEHRGINATGLQDRLLAMTSHEMSKTTIMIYISPQALAGSIKDGKPNGCAKLIKELARR